MWMVIFSLCCGYNALEMLKVTASWYVALLGWVPINLWSMNESSFIWNSAVLCIQKWILGECAREISRTSSPSWVHPSIFHTRVIPFRVAGGWSLSQLPLGERQGIPWTGCQFITGPTHWQYIQPCMLSLASTVNYKLPRTCMVLDCGRKPKQREHENSQTPHRQAPDI